MPHSWPYGNHVELRIRRVSPIDIYQLCCIVPTKKKTYRGLNHNIGLDILSLPSNNWQPELWVQGFRNWEPFNCNVSPCWYSFWSNDLSDATNRILILQINQSKVKSVTGIGINNVLLLLKISTSCRNTYRLTVQSLSPRFATLLRPLVDCWWL